MKKLLLSIGIVCIALAPLGASAQNTSDCSAYGPNYVLSNGSCVPSSPPQTAPSNSITVNQYSGAGAGGAGAASSNTGCPNGGQLVNGACNLGYTPLEPIPGINTGANGVLSFPELLGNIYKITITIGALFSVLMLTISGIRYMVSDIVTSKEAAKKRITACLYALVLIAASWLILNTINPQLVQFNLNPTPVTVPTNTANTGGLAQTASPSPTGQTMTLDGSWSLSNAQDAVTFGANCEEKRGGTVIKTPSAGGGTTYTCSK